MPSFLILLFSPDILDQQRIQLIHILLNDLKFCAALFPDMQDCILHFSIEHPCVHLAFKHIIIDLIDLSLHLFICRHLSAIPNIDGTMGRIDAMMDKVVQAFDKQLDALFADEALDISTDITVLEQMLAREGLGGMQMGQS